MGFLIIMVQSAVRRQAYGRIRRVAVGVAATLLLCLPNAGHAGTLSGEYSLKAAFIYNFAKYVEWPDSVFKGKREFCIGTLGRSQIDRELAELGGKSVHGRSIVFRQFNSPEEASQCQVLFISRSELPRLELILDYLNEAPVLTVADRDDFCRNGGMLSLVVENSKIAFDVNIRETLRARLKPNPQLLRLTRRIYGR